MERAMRSLARLVVVVALGLSWAAAAAAQSGMDPAETLEALRAASLVDLPEWRFCAGPLSGAGDPALDDGSWEAVSLPHFGPRHFASGWYRTRFTVPGEVGGVRLEGLTLVLVLQAEERAEVFVNGEVRATFSSGDGRLVVSEQAEPGATLSIAVRAEAVRGAPGLRAAWIEVEPLSSLLSACHDVQRLAAGRPDEPGLQQIVEGALGRLHLMEGGRTREEAAEALGVLTAASGAVRQYQATLVAHAWGAADPLGGSGDEAPVLFASVLDLMEQYPLFRFAYPGAAPYWLTEEGNPALFEQVRARVRQGRWEVLGGAWTDVDCTLADGESLVRQFLYGKRYVGRALGQEVRVAWLPESLGYNWNLPQILRKSGIDYFITSQMNWNDTNPFPHHLFRWQAPDGSSVLCYFPFGGTMGPLRAEGIINQLKAVERETGYRDLLVLFSGGGGGAPSGADIEKIRALKERPVFPRLAMRQVGQWFGEIPAEAESRLPVWNDELYLENYREAYTSWPQVKRAAREAETMVNEAERWCALGTVAQQPYPYEELGLAWRRLLSRQTEADLAGRRVTARPLTALADLLEARDLAQGRRQEALRAIAGAINTHGLSSPLVVFNSLGWSRTGVVEASIPDAGPWRVLDSTGREAPAQVGLGREGEPVLLFVAAEVPALGYRTYQLQRGQALMPREENVRADETTLANGLLEVRLDPESGEISSIFDKANQRQVLTPGERGNQLQLLDRPGAGQPGKIPGVDTPYAIARRVERIEVLERGPVRAVLRVVKSSLSPEGGRSRYVQDLVLTAGSGLLEIRSTVDWRERDRILKAVFPLGFPAESATYEMPYGVVARPTRRDSDWERARWEVPVQRWADLSYGDYGVSMLNDCKYGMDIHYGAMGLTLLGSAGPIGLSGEGVHTFAYALYPHAGDWRSGTLRQANEFDHPLICVSTSGHRGSLPAVRSFASVDAQNVVIEAVKRAEDSEALVFRLVEYYGRPTTVRLALPGAPRHAALTDLLENELEALPPRNPLEVPVGAYEIVTVKVSF